MEDLCREYQLSDEQIAKLKQFEEVTNSEDHEVNICTLASLEWDLQRAIENHLVGVADPVIPMEQDDADDIQIIESNVRILPAAIIPPPRLPTTRSRTRAQERLDFHASSSSLANGLSMDDDGLIGISDEDFTIESDDLETTSCLNGAPLIPTEVNCVTDAINNFSTVFNSRYIESAANIMPSFFNGSLSDAIREAFDAPNRAIEERRPLALYVHSDKSVCANIFASTILCNNEIATLLKHQYILWPWDISFSENERKLKDWLNLVSMSDLRQQLDYICRNENKLPLLILITREKGTYNNVDICYGSDTINMVTNKLMSGIRDFDQIRLTELNEHRDRVEREQIRMEQAKEYEASLAADKARMEAKMKEIKEQQLEEERKIREAEEEKLHRAKLASELPEEPEESEPGVVVVKFRLPNDEQRVRRFLKSEKLATLLTFLGAEGYDNNQYRFMNSDFPKKDVAKWDGSKTFDELKWPVREQIFVEEV